MKIIIPKEVKAVIETLGNKTKQTSGIKIYTALLLRTNRTDKFGFFDCPSTYLQAVNSRYATIIGAFIEAGIIKRKETLKIDPNDIFNTIKSPTYSSHLGYCMKYKFLIDLTIGEELEINFDSGIARRWYNILQNSLIEFGYPPKIKRDNFGRRVYHPAIKNYKLELTGKGLYVIDAIASQPTLLWLMMNERGYKDTYYNSIFDSKIDFYTQVANDLNLADRNKAKKLFTIWANSDKKAAYASMKELFPIATQFLNELKGGNYKNSSSTLQRYEASIWVDDLLENIPAEFALPVHDSLIVKEEDLLLVLDYCNAKYPLISFATRPL